MIPFPPVVEPDLPGAFITKHPREGHDEPALKIPFLTGLTFDEGAMKSARKHKYLVFVFVFWQSILNLTFEQQVDFFYLDSIFQPYSIYPGYLMISLIIFNQCCQLRWIMIIMIRQFKSGSRKKSKISTFQTI